MPLVPKPVAYFVSSFRCLSEEFRETQPGQNAASLPPRDYPVTSPRRLTHEEVGMTGRSASDP